LEARECFVLSSIQKPNLEKAGFEQTGNGREGVLEECTKNEDDSIPGTEDYELI
jgi:hypothetical protein